MIYFLKFITDILQSWDEIKFKLYLFWFIIYVIAYHTVAYFRIKYVGLHENEWSRYLYKKFLPIILKLDNQYVESLGTGKLLHTVTEWIKTRVSLLVNALETSIWLLIVTLFAWIYLIKISRVYFVIFLCISFLFNRLSSYFKHYGLERRRLKYERKSESTRQIVKMLMSKTEILQSNKSDEEILKNDLLLKEAKQFAERQRPYEHWSYNSIEIAVEVMRVVILYLVWMLILDGKLWFWDLIAYTTLIAYLSKSSQSFATMMRSFIRDIFSVEKLREVVDKSDFLCGYTEWKKFIYKQWNIKINTISYAYNKWSDIFHNLSLELHWKQKTALVGPSGWGKTTLVKLIAWYLYVREWWIFVDDQVLPTLQNVEDWINVNLQSYYKHIGYLTQEPSVFDGTIRENLEYGLSDISEAKQSIEAIIPLAKCERIYDLPHWIDTEIGERGVRLSGGQKQRLAIAKIMLKNPDIILLDEPTSALDSANEQAVTEALNNLFKNKTVIIIAHRLQTVKNADDIIYIADGKVIERWTHAELLALWWEYYTMVELQSGF